MEVNSIIDAVLSRDTIDVPSLQGEFSLSYMQASEIIKELLQANKIVYDSGITYKVKEKAPANNGNTNAVKYAASKFCGYPDGELCRSDDELFCRALRECIFNHTVSVQFLRRHEGFSYETALSAIQWMKKNGAVEENNGELRLVMTLAEYYTRFAEYERFGKISDFFDLSEPDDEDDDEDDGIEDVDEENEAKRRATFFGLTDKTNGVCVEKNAVVYSMLCGMEEIETETGRFFYLTVNGIKLIISVSPTNIIRISDGGHLYGGCAAAPEEKEERELIEANGLTVVENSKELVISVTCYDDVRSGLFKMYSVIDAIKRLRKKSL